MPANPAVGLAFRQQYLRGEAEDMFEITELDGRVSVLYQDFDGLVVTHDWAPLEPDVIEQKYYARGVGLVLAEKIAGGTGREALIEWTTPGSR